MRWTKTKQLIERQFCASSQKRLAIHTTQYRTRLGVQRRVWLTLDGREIFNASTAQFLWQHDRLWDDVRQRTDAPFPNCLYELYPEFIDQTSLFNYSTRIVEQQNTFDADRVLDSLIHYITLSIDDALACDDVIVRAFAMLDNRLGKRRLKAGFAFLSHPLITQLYDLRCGLENIKRS